MALSQLTEDLNKIQALEDRPNSNSGMSATELKTAFDEAVNIIKTFINGTTLVELASTTLSSSGADNIGSDRIYGASDTSSDMTIRGQLEKLKDEIAGVSQGAVPDGTITDAKLSNTTGEAKANISTNTSAISALMTSLNDNYYDKTEADGRYLKRTTNLSDLNSLSSARTNLEVYSKTETNNLISPKMNKASNLSDVSSVTSARTNLSVYSKSETDNKHLIKASNLSDLASASIARSNLGLGNNALVTYTKSTSVGSGGSDGDVHYQYE